MKRNLKLILLLSVFFTGSLETYSQENSGIFSLDGIWQLRQQGSLKIYNARVPGVVHLDLERNKVIPDPFYGTNEKSLQWISDTGWVYEKYFELDRSFFANRHIQLVCEGIDTYANVFINDSLVVTADNMFKTWYANIKHYLRIGYNKIKVEFPSVTKLNEREYNQLPYRLPGDEKVVCRKASYHFGWDWGPRFLTMGIWKPIYIKYWKYVNVLGVQYIQKSLTDSLAKMSASFIINSALSDTAEFKLMLDSTVFFSGREILSKGVNAIRIDFDMTNPTRWWPNGMGPATLYNIGYQVWFAGRLEAESHQNIGLRTVELVQDRDSIGRSFYLKVNDKPVFVRGANYIPMDHFPSRVTDSMYRALLTDVKVANMNMLRVWGGGIYENDIFYDLCDEKGIMVWQDFMFANAMYPDDLNFFKNVRSEAIQNIVRLRRHPSIVLWCGNNEIEEGWFNWDWSKKYGYDRKDSANIYHNYRKIFHVMLPYSVKRHDSLRPYIPTSPKYGWGRDESLTHLDMHYWGVWWGKEPFKTYEKNVGRFMSEYGFQGFPDYSTIEKFTQPSERYLGSPTMKAHQKHPEGYETIAEYMKRDYKVPTDFKMYGYVSQLLQADGIKTAIDAHRRAKPNCMGTLYWQFNDTWPVVSWSSRDYFGNKKALFYTASRSYRNFFVSPVMDGDNLKVYATLDETDNDRAKLRVVLSDLNGRVLWQEELDHNFLADRTEVVIDTNLSTYLTGEDKSTLFIYARIENLFGVMATNLTYFVPPKELKLESAPIDISVKKLHYGYLINLYTTKLAKGVFIKTPVQGSLTDNYFDLLPFEEKNISFFTNKQMENFKDSLEVISLIDAYPEE